MKKQYSLLQYAKGIYWKLNKSPLNKQVLSLRRQLANQERHTPCVVAFFGHQMNIVDSASFFSQFKEIFVDEIYRFTPLTNTPLIYDIGANIGMGTLYLKRCFPHGRIVALEADPVIAAALEKNIVKNQLADVVVIAKAAWINDEGVAFASDGADGGSISDSSHSTNVPSVRLKTLLENESENIDFLKMDIEGAEATVLPDLAGVLHKVRHIFVEYHSWSKESQKLNEILSILSVGGFRYYVQTIGSRHTPFINTDQHLPMDLQLNIFGWKVDSADVQNQT